MQVATGDNQVQFVLTAKPRGYLVLACAAIVRGLGHFQHAVDLDSRQPRPEFIGTVRIQAPVSQFDGCQCPNFLREKDMRFILGIALALMLAARRPHSLAR